MIKLFMGIVGALCLFLASVEAKSESLDLGDVIFPRVQIEDSRYTFFTVNILSFYQHYTKLKINFGGSGSTNVYFIGYSVAFKNNTYTNNLKNKLGLEEIKSEFLPEIENTAACHSQSYERKDDSDIIFVTIELEGATEEAIKKCLVANIGFIFGIDPLVVQSQDTYKDIMLKHLNWLNSQK